ncbi:hypothetical protein KQH42_18205 [Streptomyces sp. CHA1]|uniref:hypothetical protein n=1 Tax=Streptomyces TaxID=1883 RepID=UPI00053D0786|nr:MULTISPECIES: hypothetical protein [unclassified Streptomyces]QPA00878.1 hypothetical protein DI273_19315 [Streptomyces violascens]WDV32680.1 hypothetical protein OIM90_19335 [Streptomyces sp. AD16]WSB20825.1 hypothetical protein OHB02_11630 [Streptomyces albidoflavus]MBP3079280.1 hypothetical protein [Streptomyces sp. 604F]MBT3158276.1 hypothetical protein [Streptomyces sp. G11C]
MSMTRKLSAAGLAAAAALGLGLASAAPASAAGPTGCKSYVDAKSVKGYAECAGGAGYVRVIVTCRDYRGTDSKHRGSWVAADSSAASVYSCGGQTAWAVAAAYETEIRID